MGKFGWFDFEFEVVGVVGNGRINCVRSDFYEAPYLASTQFGPPF